MIHDLYLRAHIVVSGSTSGQAKQSAKRSPKLWPDYALVWDTETVLDLEQTLNFGVWRFCQLQGTEYVAVQEGIFYRDGLAPKDIQTILAYKQKHLAAGEWRSTPAFRILDSGQTLRALQNEMRSAILHSSQVRHNC